MPTVLNVSSATTEPQLSLCLLGGLQVGYAGQPPLRLGYDKVRALLAYLVIESPHGPLRRAQLAELFWPQVSAETARNNLRRTLHDLRQALQISTADGAAMEWFVSDRQHIVFQLTAACRVDVQAFLQTGTAGSEALPAHQAAAKVEVTADPERQRPGLEQQLALYRGEFMQGLSLPDAPEFEHWLAKQRALCKQQAVSLLRLLAEQQLAAGHINPALAAFERALSLDPCAEDVHAQLMRELARHGRNAEALRQFDLCRSVLWNELGSEPAPPTLALARAIRRGELAVSADTVPLLAQVGRQRVCVLVCELRLQSQPGQEADLRWLAECHGSLMDIVNSLGGHGIALHATRFLAYFGYPQPHEQAAQRAVEAALDMTQFAAVTAALELRVGGHCGWLVNDPHFLLPDATGITTQQALSLTQQLAWGEVAICPQLAHQVEHNFMLEDLAPGINGQRVRACSLAAHPLDIPTYRPTPFVGRSAELRQLREFWQQACQGAVRTVLLCAEAGMGKSRLMHRFQEEVDQQGGVCWTLRCLPEFTSTPFYPCVEFLERLLERTRAACRDGTCTATCDTTEQRLECWLATEATELAGHRAAFAELLHLPSNTEAARLSKQERRQRVDEALFALFEFLARQAPSLFLAEDLHWVDATTLEWLNRYLAQSVVPGMLLVSARPEVQPPVGMTVLRLSALSAKQSLQLMRQLGSMLSEAQLLHIQQRADGVPLYLEELARALDKGKTGEFPATLWNLLATRLEAVGAAKRLAQQAAVIGRFFDLTLLRALWDGDERTLDAQLESLYAAGLVLARAPQEAYFRHALFHDVARETLTVAESKRLHARLARLYEGAFNTLVARHPERLAQHLTAADEPLAAARVWLQAGQLAAESSMYQEAIIHFETGISLVCELSAGSTLEIQLQTALGMVWLALKGYGSETAKVCFSRVMELSKQADDDPALFPAMWGLWLGGRSCTPQAYPLELVHKLQRIARISQQPAHQMQVHYAYGNNLLWMARLDEAREHLQQAIEIGRQQLPAALIQAYGEDTRISSAAFLVWTHWLQGRPDTALQLMETTVAEARQLHHANTLGFALTFSALLQRFMLNAEAAARQAHELAELSRQHGLALWQAVATGVAGWASAAQGHPEGLQQTTAAIEMARAAMSAAEPTFWGLHIAALHALGHFHDCALQAEVAIGVCHEHLDYYLLPELWRMRGEALNGLPGERQQALHSLEQALELARAQGAKSLELRAAHALLQRSRQSRQRSELETRIADLLAACPELQAPV